MLCTFSSPIFCYGELLETVQTLGVFNDSKQFVDMPLRADPGRFPPSIKHHLLNIFSCEIGLICYKLLYRGGLDGI